MNRELDTKCIEHTKEEIKGLMNHLIECLDDKCDVQKMMAMNCAYTFINLYNDFHSLGKLWMNTGVFAYLSSKNDKSLESWGKPDHPIYLNNVEDNDEQDCEADVMPKDLQDLIAKDSRTKVVKVTRKQLNALIKAISE